MPRFFIDTTDQERFVRDDEGSDYTSLDAAKAAAVGTLPDMARDDLPDGDARNFLAIVRNAKGDPVLQASLALNVTSLVPTERKPTDGDAEEPD